MTATAWMERYRAYWKNIDADCCLMMMAKRKAWFASIAGAAASVFMAYRGASNGKGDVPVFVEIGLAGAAG